MKRKILVTEGAGFVGSHLCDYLIIEGHEVLCLDNFFTENKENIMHLLDHKCFELIRHDITKPFLLSVMRFIILPVHHTNKLPIQSDKNH